MKIRSTPILTIGFILITGLAYVLQKKKGMKRLFHRINYSEKRAQIRQDLYAHALVKKEGTEYQINGELINVSNRGAYLTTSGHFSKDELLDLTIYFVHGTKELSMTVPCKVARVDEKGTGLTSSQIDTDLLLRLEVIFDVSKENTRQLIEEFIKAI